MTMRGGVEFAGVSFTPPPDRGGGSPAAPILQNISISIEAGSVTALLGRSGSGKTTLLRTVNGLVTPTGGQVLVEGEPVGAANLLALRHRIGYVIQETGLFPHMSIGRNVALPLELAGVRLQERTERAAAMLRRVSLPPEQYAHRLPWQLSGGQRQRAGLARALSADPAILLMDEPFGALDPLTRAEMQAMLRDLLAESATTVLVVTHDLDEALFLATRVLFLAEGRIAADLPSQEVMHSQHPAVAQYVRAVRRFEAAR